MQQDRVGDSHPRSLSLQEDFFIVGSNRRLSFANSTICCPTFWQRFVKSPFTDTGPTVRGVHHCPLDMLTDIRRNDIESDQVITYFVH